MKIEATDKSGAFNFMNQSFILIHFRYEATFMPYLGAKI